MSQLAWLAAAIAAQGAPGADLFLICEGHGDTPAAELSRAHRIDASGEGATATVRRSHALVFADSVNVEIRGQDGRIRIPYTMLPLLHGGERGWFALSELRVGEHEITARAAVNFISRPDVRIDRITGTLTISGRIGYFAAQCEPYDPDKVRRRF